jgi:Outer membrane protein beta-barrel domain
MRKLLLSTIIALFFGNVSSVLAQNYLAYNSEYVRTSVDGASHDYFGLNVPKSTKMDIQQGVGAAFFTAKDGLNTPFYGLTYNFAYPISMTGSSRFYLAVNPSFMLNDTKNVETGRTQSSYGLDIPVVAELHFGAPKSFGALFGLGVAYNYLENNSMGFKMEHKAFGPLAEAGIRVPIGGKTLLLKSTYQFNFAKETIGNYTTGDVFSLSLGVAF